MTCQAKIVTGEPCGQPLTDRQRWALNLATKPTDTEEGTNER